MKKLFLAVVSLLLITSCAYAEIDWSKIPMNQGIAFSLADSEVNYLGTFEVAKWKNISLGAGYAGRAKETKDKAAVALSYDLLKLKDYTNLPILDLVELKPCIYGGIGRTGGTNEFDWGVGSTILVFKFH